ncbi:MAG: cytochrome c biogenesis protein CcdA [Patescibacteria group bacterium]
MKKLLIGVGATFFVILGIVALKYSSGLSDFLWNISQGGVWLLPLVVVSAILDSVHPCSFSILLITIAFLFGLQMTRKKILQIGGLYVAGIFAAYFAIGVGLLHVLHLFDTPHFMGKLGAAALIIFGVLNLLGALVPNFPIKLKIPDAAHRQMARLINAISLPAAFALGLLVGLCQFPCMGGPYLMIIGLLHDQATYISGFGYLLFYNTILIAPLVVTLFFASHPLFLDKMKEWRATRMKNVHLVAGIAMTILGALILFI